MLVGGSIAVDEGLKIAPKLVLLFDKMLMMLVEAARLLLLLLFKGIGATVSRVIECFDAREAS